MAVRGWQVGSCAWVAAVGAVLPGLRRLVLPGSLPTICCPAARPPLLPRPSLPTSAAAAGVQLLSSLPDAPKIRVIVRKRPLNKKVDQKLLHCCLRRADMCSCYTVAAPRCSSSAPLPNLALPQELEKCETDVLECDSQAACLYVNEPKTKVDLTKYIERHTFRWVLLAPQQLCRLALTTLEHMPAAPGALMNGMPSVAQVVLIWRCLLLHSVRQV